jgi:alanine-glyoxylate transaminase/serine-glyoxylate transaminase/serine-pyruvate transaminase
MELVMGYWGASAQRAYHHTAPINALYGLHEALVILQDEGLENAWERHRKHHNALAAGFEALGLKFVVDAEYRLPQLNCVTLPDGVEDGGTRRQLLGDYQLEIGAGLGPLAGRVWRIGLMGYAANQKNVLLCLGALDSVLLQQGVRINSGQAVTAAQAVYSGKT